MSHEEIERIQVFGARCSGTTRLRNLLAKNFLNVTVLPTNAEGQDNFGWKHGRLGSEIRLYVDGRWIWLNDFGSHFLRHVDDNRKLDIYEISVKDRRYAGIDSDEDAYIKSHAVPLTRSDLLIVVSRNPIAWLQSVYRTPYHALALFDLRDKDDLLFENFIREPWQTYMSSPRIDDAENTGKRQKWIDKGVVLEDAATIFEHRAASLALFNGFSQNAPNVAYVTHEDVNRSEEDCVAQIAKMYDIQRTPSLRPTLTYKGLRDTEPFQPRPIPMRLQDLRLVVAALDWGLEETVGYEPAVSSTLLTKKFCADPANKVVKANNQSSPRFYRNGEICAQI